MKPKATLRHFLLLAGSSLLAAPSAFAATYTWANSNVTGLTPPASLNWFNATQGTWTGGTPVSGNTNVIQFFQDNTTALPNTGAAGNTQASVADSGSAFQLGTLTLSGRGSATTGANLTMNLSGDALNFSAATGTINLDALNNTRTITYNVANNIQLGSVGTPGALTFTGDGTSAFNFTGAISQLQAGGSIIKDGASTMTLGGTSNFSGGVRIDNGTLRIATQQDFTGGVRINGGTLHVDLAGTNVLDANVVTFAGNGAITGINNATTTMSQLVVNNGVAGTLNAVGGASRIYTFTNGITDSATPGARQLNFSGGTTGPGNGKTLNLNDSSGFTGTLNLDYTVAASTTSTLSFTGLGDGGKLQYSGRAGSTSTSSLALNYSGAGTTFSTRQLELTGGGGVNITHTGASGALVFSQALSVTGTLAKTLGLGGSNAAANGFNGAIDDGASAVISITKSGTGNWALGSANNDFTGAITLSSTTTSAGTLSYASAGGANPITFSQTTGSANLTYNGATAKTMSGAITATALTSGTITLASTGAGAVNYSNAASLGSNTGLLARKLILDGSNTGDNTLAGAWVNNTGVGAAGATLTKNGTGKWILSGANTYTGLTSVSNGTLLATQAASLPGYDTAGRVTVANNATLAVRAGGAGWTSGQIDSLLAPANWVAGSKLGIDVASGSFTYANDIGTTQVAKGLVKSGAGTLELTGTHNYTGATSVDGGKLLVNANISTSVLTTVKSGATLGGTGTVGDLTIDSGGFFSPGNSPGIETVDGNYIQNGTLQTEIEGLTAGNGIGFHDQVVVNGTVTLNGALQILTLTGTYAENDLIFILLNDDTDDITGTFTGLVQGASVGSYAGFDWKISYTGSSGGTPSFTGGNDVVLMAIPEPNVAALIGGFGVLSLLRRRRA